jgi:hypothetical protein
MSNEFEKRELTLSEIIPTLPEGLSLVGLEKEDTAVMSGSEAPQNDMGSIFQTLEQVKTDCLERNGDCSKKDVLIAKDDFLKELAKNNKGLAEKLTPVLSWVSEIHLKPKKVELLFMEDKFDTKKGPEWKRDAVLAPDIDTKGLYLKRRVECGVEENDAGVRLTNLDGLQIALHVKDIPWVPFPLHLDKTEVLSLSLSQSGEDLKFDVGAKNPAPILDKFLPKERQRPNIIHVEIYLNKQGELRMKEIK